MNCFDWQNRSSDYLDGILMGALKKEADEHLDECPSCSERHRHYRLIVNSISGQPRSALPVPIRKSPLAVALPRIDFPGRRSTWDRMPWFIRTSIEGLGVAFAILFVVALVPRLRSLYERSVEKKLDALLMADPSMSAPDSSVAVPLARGKLAPVPGAPADEFNGEVEDEGDDSSESADSSENELRVGNSEIWRFSLKTDSPREMRPKVVQILNDLKIRPDTPGIGGIEAPGGIQFDLLVPQSVVTELKQSLAKLAVPAAQLGESKSPLDESFTWYKNKSKKTIPAGMSRVVIWLSQL